MFEEMKEVWKRLILERRVDVKKVLLFSFIFGLLIFIYFSFLPVISPDSSNYYYFMGIIRGDYPISSWNPTRGPSMPLVLYLITLILGDNVYGFLIVTFISYLVLLFCIYIIIREMQGIYKGTKEVIWPLFILFIVFNPLTIGYYHAMLTEFLATTISVVCCLLAYKWVNREFKKGKVKFLLNVFLFSFLTIFLWFLKQPYLSLVFFPLLLATLLSIIKIKNRVNSITKIASLIFVLVSLLVSIRIWDNFLARQGISSSADRTESFVSSGLVNGLSNFREISDVDIIYIEENEFLSEVQKEEIKNIMRNQSQYKEYRLYEIYNLRGELIGIDVWFRVTDNPISNYEAFKYVLKRFKNYPILSIDSYVSNYLATINIYEVFSPDYMHYYPVKTLKSGQNENRSLSLAAFVERPIYWWWPLEEEEGRIMYMPRYEKVNKPNMVAKKIINLSTEPSLFLFKIVFFISPFLFIYLSVVYVKNIFRMGYFEYSKLYELLIILFGFAFFHVLLHAITGGIIDRYAFVAYPSTLLGTILLLKLFSRRKNGVV